MLWNRIFARAVPDETWKYLRSHWLWGCTVFAIAVSRFFWYGIQQPYVIYPDSTEYIAFDTSAVLQGSLEKACGRAPLYGMFLDLLGWISGENYLDAAKFIQLLFSLLSILVFAKLLCRLGVSTPWCQIVTFLYGTTPAIVGWDSTILTESLSISGSVLFLYLAVLYIQEHRSRYGILLLVLATALTFLRPQFLTYLALLGVFFVLKLFFPFDRFERRRVLGLLLLEVIFLGGILGYCKGFQKATGIFSLTTALPVQNMRICIDRGYYTEFDDTEMSAFIAQKFEEGKRPVEVFNETCAKYGYQRIGDEAKQYLSHHPWQNLRDTIDIIVDDLQTDFCGYALKSSNINSHATGLCFKVYSLQMGLFGFVTVAHVLCASLLEGIAMVIVWIRRRKLPWIHMALFSISASTVFPTYFVTCAEYMRTMISVLPCVYCVAALFFQMCTNHCQDMSNAVV